MEECGQLLCQDTVPAGECKNHDREQPRPGQVMIPTSMHLAQVGDESGCASSYHLLANPKVIIAYVMLGWAIMPASPQ